MKNNNFNLVDELAGPILNGNILEIFKAYSPIIITYTAGLFFGLAVSKYKIYRDNYNYKKVINLPPEVKNNNCIQIKHDVSKHFEDIVKIFLDTINLKLPHVNQKLLLHNLNTVKITERSILFFKLRPGQMVIGEYSPTDNQVSIIKGQSLNVITHELLHMASSCTDEVYSYSGFLQLNRKNSIAIGEGLNEGYTTILDERYFPDYFKTNGYKTEKIICLMLEKIVDQEDMEKMYFESNLYGLVEKLKQYESEEEILKFITKVDFINKYKNTKNKTVYKYNLESLRTINKFLLDCYLNKISNDFKNNIIDQETMQIKISTFISMLISGVIYDDKKYELYTSDEFEKMVTGIEEDITVAANRQK